MPDHGDNAEVLASMADPGAFGFPDAILAQAT